MGTQERQVRLLEVRQISTDRVQLIRLVNVDVMMRAYAEGKERVFSLGDIIDLVYPSARLVDLAWNAAR